nr:hypothetical protein [Tanacetum cinerariifolium]
MVVVLVRWSKWRLSYEDGGGGAPANGVRWWSAVKGGSEGGCGEMMADLVLTKGVRIEMMTMVRWSLWRWLRRLSKSRQKLGGGVGKFEREERKICV